MLEDFMTDTTVVPRVSAKKTLGKKEGRIGVKELVHGSDTMLHAANVMKLSILHCFLPPFHPRSAVLFWSAILWFEFISLFTLPLRNTQKRKKKI